MAWSGISAGGCQAEESPLRLVHFGDQSRRFSFDGVQAMRLIRDASAGIAPPSLTARDVTPLAAARAQAARRATGSRLQRPDRLSSRRTRRTIRPRARELRRTGRWCRALCSARAGRDPTFPCPSRAPHPRAFARGRWPVMAYYRLRHFHFPAARARPGAPRTPPGRFRALHITRALCAGGARRSAHQLARAGAWRRSSRKAGGFDERRKEFFVRAFGADCRRVTLRASLRARHGPRRAGDPTEGPLLARLRRARV
jgi:hypothetical protein